jgi:secreted PhoX family phosphatase
MFKRIAATSAVLGLLAAGSLPAHATDKPVYMEAIATGATLDVLATSGDTIGGYALPGTPDGIGAYKDSKGIQLIVNHEFTAVQAAFAQANGAVTGGSTVSQLTLDPATGKITAAKELLNKVTWYNYQTKTYGATPTAPTGTAEGIKNYYGLAYQKNLDRFCSSSLAAAGTFSYKSNGKSIGYDGAIYFTPEESGNESRGFAMNTSGELVQLPKLGLAGQETFNAAATTNAKTVIVGNEDDAVLAGELRLYVGTKNNSGRWFEKAGLTNGVSYFAKVDGISTDLEFRSFVGKGTPAKVTFNKYDTNATAVSQNSHVGSLSTGFSRIEDGAFDPSHPNDYYFITTESAKWEKSTTLDPQNSDVTARDGGALWRLRFKDVNDPLKGATVEMLLDGSEWIYANKPDNITIDSLGHILIQEDPGGNDQVSRIFAYDIKSEKLAVIAKFKDAYFKKDAPAATKITNDEESSGILDVSKLYRKSSSDKSSYYVLDAQVHATVAASRPDLSAAEAAALTKVVEGGQLYLLKIPAWSAVTFK